MGMWRYYLFKNVAFCHAINDSKRLLNRKLAFYIHAAALMQNYRSMSVTDQKINTITLFHVFFLFLKFGRFDRNTL